MEQLKTRDRILSFSSMPLYLIRQITTRFFQKYHIWYCVGHLDFKAIQSIRKIRCLVLTRRKFVSAELKGSVYDPRIHRSGRMKPEGFFNDGSEVRHPFNGILFQSRFFTGKFLQNFPVEFLLRFRIFGKPGRVNLSIF